MIVTNFKVPIFEFEVTMVEIESSKDADLVTPIFQKVKMAQEDIVSEIDTIRKGCFNGGNTYRNTHLRKFVVVLYPFTSQRARINVISHEKRHVEDRILEHCLIDDMETAAYLAGFLSEKMF